VNRQKRALRQQPPEIVRYQRYDAAMSARKGRITVSSPECELCLTFVSGPCAGRTGLVVAKNNTTLGRGEDCDVILDGETVSRRHCSITKWGNAYFVLDSSRNGTFLNGQRVAQAQLQDNDQIRVGQNVLLVNLPSGLRTSALSAKATTPHLVTPLLGIKPRIVVKGLEEGVTQPFNEDRITMGRRADNHLVLDGDNISRQHVAIERRLGQYFICDLGSINGTYLNDQRVETAPLQEGDRVRIGNLAFTVSLREQDCILNFKKVTGE
jgi:pSer/pThr/pTyr-binding forkhead associated (FHA) protein